MSVHGTITAKGTVTPLRRRPDARRAPVANVPVWPEAEPHRAAPAPREPSAETPVPRVRLGVSLDNAAQAPGRVRLSVDCLLTVPSDEVLVRRLTTEVRAERPDPRRLLRLALRMLEAEGGTGEVDVAAADTEMRRLEPALLDRLTPRERRVALMAMEGLRNKEIARRLCRSVRTVECQISSALRKLRIGSRVQLMRALEAEALSAADPAGEPLPPSP